MKKLLALAIAGIVLGGCMTLPKPKPGQYADYRAMAYAESTNMKIKGVTGDLKRKLQICTVDTTIAHMTPSEIHWLDAYARGEIEVRRSDIRSFEESLIHRMGGEDGTMKAMAKQCPEAMAELSKYKT
jgi:hypothetical protein